MAITLGTFGSGLDVESIVKALVDADIAPKTNSLDRRESGLKAELSAIGSLKSVLSDLDKSLTDLKDGSAFNLMSIDAPAAVDILQTDLLPSVSTVLRLIRSRRRKCWLLRGLLQLLRS